jgi:GT2 family glycosyltransferase
MSAKPQVSVVIPTYCRPELLARCLRALQQQTLAATDFEIIVVDDDISEAPDERVMTFGTSGLVVRRLSSGGRRGPAVARNVGWRAASAPLIAFTDDDTVPDPDWLRVGIAALVPPRVAIWGRIIVPTPARPTDYERNTKGLECAEFATANVFILRSALETVGGFDERFRRAWREDADLYFSLLENVGEVAHEPAAVVLHPVRLARWGECLRQHSNLIFDALLYKKHPVLYRTRLRPGVPIAYYVAVLSFAASAALAITGPPLAWLVPLPFAIVPVARLARVRLTGTSTRWAHRLEVLVTSLLIPFFAVFWRLRGALRYRVLFL